MVQTLFTVRRLVSVVFTVAILLVPGRSAMANTMLDYTFSGVASGTIVGANVLSSSTFSNQNFSISFIEDPSTVTGSGGYYSLSSINGAFTEGSFSGTLTNGLIEVNGNPNTGAGAYETINLFNSTFATDMQIVSDPALLNYALATTLAETGSSTGQAIANYSGAGYSLSNGDVLDISNLNSLNFSVTDVPSAVPEPSTLVLLGVGLGAMFVLLRRSSLKEGAGCPPGLC
jgi:hypothetical protein